MTIQGRRPSNLQKYGMLLMGVFLVILAGGRFVTPAAAFLAPVFLLMFTRNTDARSGIGILYVLLFVSLAVRMHGYIPAPRGIHFVIVAGLALCETAPFWLDRKLFRKLPTAMVPFVLPSAVVAIGFVFPLILPFGTLSAAAYTQIYNFELMQLAAVTGIYGITFVVLWFASTMASLWDSGFVWRTCRKQFLPMSVCLMLIFVSGGFRNIFDENESATVRVAGLAGGQTRLQQSLREIGVDEIFAAGEPAENVKAILDRYHDDLFARSEREAKAGAKIISWAEGDAVVFQQDEADFLARSSEFAQLHGIYLVTALVVVPTVAEQAVINKLVVLEPAGLLAAEYIKTRRLPGENFADGTGEPAILDTKYGRLALFIGLDLDAPRLVRKAGKADADIIIAPSSDWKTISPHHSYMAAFRGVENGASVFRVADQGLSLISDPHGRVLAQVDHYRSSPHTLVGEVPVKGVSTVYARAGDWFGWLNLLLLFGLGWRGYRKHTSMR